MSRVEEPEPRGWGSPRRWHLFSLRRPVVAYIVAVDVLALSIAIGTMWLVPVTAQHWAWFGLLSLSAVVHLEAARGIERMREITGEGTGHTHLQSVWLFAGVLLLPPPLLVCLIALSYVHAWFRVYRRRALVHRKVFSAATVVLACAAAGTVLAAFHPAGTHAASNLLPGPMGLAAIVAAGILYRLMNYSLVVGVILATEPDTSARTALGAPTDHLTIAAAIGLGTGISVVAIAYPWLAPVLIVTVLALHLGLLLPYFRAVSQTDRKTGLLDPTFWYELAAGELDRARRLDSSVGVLMIDLDHFKRVNDTYGHPAGDVVLISVADTVKQSVRGYDSVCRFGGEEIAVLLPGLEADEVFRSAERIRVMIAALRVTVPVKDGTTATLEQFTASIGGAIYPDHGADHLSLIQAADAALYEAKQAGRNCTIISQASLIDLGLGRRTADENGVRPLDEV